MVDNDHCYQGEDVDQQHKPVVEEPTTRPRSAVNELQRSLGNARLVQMRRAVQRRAQVPAQDAPDWIKEGLGLSARGVPTDETATEPVDVSVPQGGQPLPAAVREEAESHLGVSMTGVSIVSGADQACRPIQAQAFTTEAGGQHVVALSSDVDLTSQDGQFTLMHELAHVAQQKQGATSDLEGLGGDDGCREHLENQADEHAKKILSQRE
jgi:hypothetical protein